MNQVRGDRGSLAFCAHCASSPDTWTDAPSTTATATTATATTATAITCRTPPPATSSTRSRPVARHSPASPPHRPHRDNPSPKYETVETNILEFFFVEIARYGGKPFTFLRRTFSETKSSVGAARAAPAGWRRSSASASPSRGIGGVGQRRPREGRGHRLRRRQASLNVKLDPGRGGGLIPWNNLRRTENARRRGCPRLSSTYPEGVQAGWHAERRNAGDDAGARCSGCAASCQPACTHGLRGQWAPCASTRPLGGRALPLVALLGGGGAVGRRVACPPTSWDTGAARRHRSGYRQNVA